MKEGAQDDEVADGSAEVGGDVLVVGGEVLGEAVHDEGHDVFPVGFVLVVEGQGF